LRGHELEKAFNCRPPAFPLIVITAHKIVEVFYRGAIGLPEAAETVAVYRRGSEATAREKGLFHQQ
jgi:hypothetical protein